MMNEIFLLDNISIFSKKKKIENINLKIFVETFL